MGAACRADERAGLGDVLLTDFPIPTLLAEYSADRAAWIAALPDTVAALAEQWSLSVGPPFEPGGQCSWVAPAGEGR